MFGPPSINSQVAVIDGYGGSAFFSLSAANGSLSSSSNLKVGGYNLEASNVNISGNNFNSLVVVGSLTVLPKVLNNNLGIQSIEKVYDGSTSITGLGLSFDRNLAGVVGVDQVALSGSGSFVDRHVGVNKAVSLSMGLSGLDANNYALTTTNLNANVGTISQLASVEYIGSANGSWSDARNWTGGALPDGNNVAQVIIPTGKAVTYDSDQVGVIGSQIANNGSIRFESPNAFNLANNISGSGVLEQRGSGMLTVSGNSSTTGAIDLGAYSLTLASENALGTGRIVSDGGSLYIANGTTLTGLNIDGAVTLMTKVNTVNDQIYNGPLTFMSTGSFASPNFRSSQGDISFMGTVSAGANSKGAQRSLAVSATNGTVLFNDQVGQDVILNRANGADTINFASYNRNSISPYSVDVDAAEIRIFGDITSFETQMYHGPALIGDNGVNGNTRLLLSMDPAIDFTSSIDDAVAGRHNLMLRAIALNVAEIPRIAYGDVGQLSALASLDVLTGVQNPLTVVADVSQPAGSIATTGTVSTTGGERRVSGDGVVERAGNVVLNPSGSRSSSSTASGSNEFHGTKSYSIAKAFENMNQNAVEMSGGAGEVVVGEVKTVKLINMDCDVAAADVCAK